MAAIRSEVGVALVIAALVTAAGLLVVDRGPSEQGPKTSQKVSSEPPAEPRSITNATLADAQPAQSAPTEDQAPDAEVANAAPERDEPADTAKSTAAPAESSPGNDPFAVYSEEADSDRPAPRVVVGPSGEPLAEFALFVPSLDVDAGADGEESSPVVFTDPEGGFDIPAGGSDDVDAYDAKYTVVAVGRRNRTEPERWVVVPARQVRGVVVDEADQPLENARVMARAQPLAALDLPDQDWRLRHKKRLAQPTDAGGAFELVRLPDLPATELFIEADGYAATVVELGRGSRVDVTVVLSPEEDSTFVVRGLVIDEIGAAVPGALVEMGGSSVMADANGRFVLRVSERDSDDDLMATSSGLLPARRPAFWEQVPAQAAAVSDVVLELESEPASQN